MPRYQDVISFGANCQTAYNIERSAGAAASLPFDWWNTPLFAVGELLESGFTAVAHRPDLRVSANRATVTNARLGVFLHHDFPRDARELVLPLTDATVELVALKYARRAAVLASILRSDCRKLIVRFDSADTDNWMKSYIPGIWREASHEDMIQAVLDASAPGSCDFLIVNDHHRPALPETVSGARVFSRGMPAASGQIDWTGNVPGWAALLSEIL